VLPAEAFAPLFALDDASSCFSCRIDRA